MFGHVIGDELLCAIARRLQHAADDAFIARVGGDEFTLILATGEQPRAAQALAERLLNAVAEPSRCAGSRSPSGSASAADLSPRRDRHRSRCSPMPTPRSIRAKADGRHMVRFFEPEMDRRLRERYALQHDLRSAIAHDELALHYQPQAKIDGEVFGFEALVRWQHPKRGLVPPSTFIPLAEQNGMIVEIGEWTLRQACREAASWPTPLQVGVNLSPVQFRHGDLASLVHSVLLDTGLAPGRLELEITEGVLIDDPPRALSILRRLKLLGVKIAMDDFGTGYASLSSLAVVPVRQDQDRPDLRLRRRSNAKSAAIVRAVIGLGQALKIPVIAEGVETEGERSFLRREGCEEIQGYLIGRPAPVATYAMLINGDRANVLMAG